MNSVLYNGDCIEEMQKLRSLFLPDYHMSITKFILERDEFIMSC